MSVELLSDLIATKSYSGEEDQVRAYIQEWFGARRIDSIVHEGNLVVRINGRDSTRAFLLNSHMDTVEAGGQWKYGPWTPTLEGDRIVGLGASDMKSGVAASMLLAEHYAQEKPPVDMWFMYVVKEEKDGSGTQSVADWFSQNGYHLAYRDIGGIFTEPSNLSEIEYGHRGNMFLKVTTQGDTGHSSRPGLIKRHSMREMVAFADELNHAFVGWANEYAQPPFSPPTVGEMTSTESGSPESPNKFPATTTSTFDVRTTPSFYAVAFQKIVALGEKLGAKVEFAFPPAPAGYTDPAEKIVTATQGIIPNAELTVSQGSADLGFLTGLGVKAIIFGPGEKNQAHQTDEYAYPAQIPQAVAIYRAIIDAWAI